MSDLSVGPTRDIAACQAIRRVVFIEEQSVPADLELDGKDEEALHVLATLGGRPVGTARILVSGPTAKIGRVAVLAELRGRGIGKALMAASLDVARGVPGVREARLGSQTHALRFYEALGFVAEGPEYMEAGIPHRDMARRL